MLPSNKNHTQEQAEYHGETNPDGKLTTLEESAAVGAPNTLPVKSYDFQGILRENGDPHESYHRLRRHHYLLREFGWLIAPAMTVLPEDTAKDPADFRSLRYAVRHDPASGGGFVWINNHLRRRKPAYHPDVTLTLDTGHGIISTPPVEYPGSGHPDSPLQSAARRRLRSDRLQCNAALPHRFPLVLLYG